MKNGTVFDPVLIKLNDEPQGYEKMMEILTFFTCNPDAARVSIMKKAVAWVIVQTGGAHNMLSHEARKEINSLLKEHCDLEKENLLTDADTYVFMNHWEKICKPFAELNQEKLFEFLKN